MCISPQAGKPGLCAFPEPALGSAHGVEEGSQGPVERMIKLLIYAALVAAQVAFAILLLSWLARIRGSIPE
jgi:hypothetical protein